MKSRRISVVVVSFMSSLCAISLAISGRAADIDTTAAVDKPKEIKAANMIAGMLPGKWTTDRDLSKRISGVADIRTDVKLRFEKNDQAWNEVPKDPPRFGKFEVVLTGYLTWGDSKGPFKLEIDEAGNTFLTMFESDGKSGSRTGFLVVAVPAHEKKQDLIFIGHHSYRGMTTVFQRAD